MAVKRSATYADIEALPENVVGEIVAGELNVSPRPRPAHGTAQSELLAQLLHLFGRGGGGPGGWRILVEPELHLHGDVVVPDIAGWRLERMPSLPKTAYIELPPDWLCEVMSESTRRFDRVEKLAVYAREQVKHVWFVDPEARVLEVLRLDKGGWVIAAMHAGAVKVRAEPFEAEEIDLSLLWPT